MISDFYTKLSEINACDSDMSGIDIFEDHYQKQIGKTSSSFSPVSRDEKS